MLFAQISIILIGFCVSLPRRNPIEHLLEEPVAPAAMHIPFDEMDVEFQLEQPGKEGILIEEKLEVIETLRQIAHAKAILILSWRVIENISWSTNLSVTVYLKNCSTWVGNEHLLKNEDYSFENGTVCLVDYDCVPDELRAWCLEKGAGRREEMTYRNQYKYIIDMNFECDPERVYNPNEWVPKIDRQSDESDDWDVVIDYAPKVIVLFGLVVWWRISRKRAPEQSKVVELQNERFLTVPSRVRPKTGRSIRLLMESRFGNGKSGRWNAFDGARKIYQRCLGALRSKRTKPAVKIVISEPED